MNPTVCPSKAELTDCLLGRLSEADCSRIEEHISQCLACESTVATQDETVDTVVAGLRRPAAEDPFSNEPEYQAALGKLHPLVTEHVLERAKASRSSGSELGNLEQIGVYRLLVKLGEGGMGAVYKAVHTKLNKQVAIKILPSQRMEDRNALERFEREMQAVGRLEHPNIVRATDAGEANGIHFLVMEYVEGVDLSTLISRFGPLPIAEACELIRQAAKGLQHVHEHGLVHRDIKPSNLMLARSGTVKILDLGLALLPHDSPEDEEALTSSGYTVGTLDYMAPEQASNSHGVDIRTDIYSLGASLYKLLTGHAPLSHTKDRPAVQRIMALINESIPPIQDVREAIPSALAELVHRMLAKEPGDRFNTPEEVATALAPFASPHNLGNLLPSESQPASLPVNGYDGLASTEKYRSSSLASTESYRPPVSPSASSPMAPVLPVQAPQPKRSRWSPKQIATAVLPVLLLMFGVVIWINRTRLVVPDGSTVAVEPNGSATITTPDRQADAKRESAAPASTTSAAHEDETTIESRSRQPNSAAEVNEGERKQDAASTRVPRATAPMERPPASPASRVEEDSEAMFGPSEAYLITHSVTMFTKTDPKINIEKHGIPMTEEQRDLVAKADGRYLGQDSPYGYQIFCFPNRGPMQLTWTGYADGNGQVSVCIWDGASWTPSVDAYRRLLKVLEPTTYSEAVSRPTEEERIYVFVNCTSGRVFTDEIFGTVRAEVATSDEER